MFSTKTGRLYKGFIKKFRYNLTLQNRGQLGEWFNPVAWNAAVGQPTVSSNLTLSTTLITKLQKQPKIQYLRTKRKNYQNILHYLKVFRNGASI